VIAFAPSAYPAEIQRLRARFGDLPVIIAGMAGSDRGWLEVPYAPCPATLADVRAAMHWVEAGRTAIVPGLALDRADAPDVMRGEETQAFGAIAAGFVGNEGLLCHPGTHCKWLCHQGSAVTGFHTTMTGELYAMLATHSILASELRAQAAVDPSFEAGVRAALAGTDILSGLFAVRARAALHRKEHRSASWASGLLIGTDVQTALKSAPFDGGIVGIIGSASLATLYLAALELAGRPALLLDAAHCFTAGIAALAWEHA
jgi:2-dehydro-3-deoxygalactonokinase